MQSLLLLLICAVFVTSNEIQPMGLFTPFDLNSPSTGYIINGFFCENTNHQCSEAGLVVDPPNNRIMFDFGPYWGQVLITLNGSYIIGNPNIDECVSIPSWTYQRQVEAYTHIVSRTGSMHHGLANYAGHLRTVCDETMGLVLYTSDDVITELSYTRDTIKPDLEQYSHGNAVYDLATIDRTSNRDSYFVVPDKCKTSSCRCDSPTTCCCIHSEYTSYDFEDYMAGF